MKITTSFKRKFIAVSIMFLFICIFAQKVYAGTQNNFDVISLFYYNSDNNDNVWFDSEQYTFCGSFSDEQKSFILYDNLINNLEPDKITFVPNGVKLLDVKISGDMLTLDFSVEITNYGGAAYEKAMIRQFAMNALNFDGIKNLTILVDSKIGFLPEGSLVYNSPIVNLLNDY